MTRDPFDDHFRAAMRPHLETLTNTASAYRKALHCGLSREPARVDLARAIAAVLKTDGDLDAVLKEVIRGGW